MLPYGKQNIDDDDIAAVVETLRSDFLTTGPKVQEFEQALCQATNAEHAVVCGNGTQALHLACLALDLKEGESIIVPSSTFLATANAARYCGADVIFADCDPDSGLMRAEDLEDALCRSSSAQVKAAIPVHLNGQSVDLESIRRICDSNDLKLITDSCHALGGSYKRHKSGSCHYEDLSTFSFHPVKTVAMGEGGAITTNNEKYAKTMRSLRSHGMEKTPDIGPWAYEMNELGYNYRASDILCALGISQMKKLDAFVERRAKLVAHYDSLLTPLSNFIAPIKKDKNCEPAWHLYAVHIDFNALGTDRAQFMMALQERGVGTQVHYIPVHKQPYYQKLYGDISLPGSEQYYEHVLSLPLFPAMQNEQVDFVVDAIRAIANQS